MRVAALYVDPNGVYAGLPDVDVWDEARDARLYEGPWPVVAHPPCARWCALAGFVEYVHGYRRGDDGGCFAAALDAVRMFGGVLEHPAHSQAWDAFGLPEPQTVEGWTGDLYGGWACEVQQGNYGHRGAKPTWLYAYGVELPAMRWGRAPESANAGWWIGPDSRRPKETRLRKENSSHTPPAFRDVLLNMARSARMMIGAPTVS